MPAPTTWSAPASGGTLSGSSFGYVSKAGDYWFAVNSGSLLSGDQIDIRYATDPTGAWSTATLPAAPDSNVKGSQITEVVYDGTTYAMALEYFYGIGPVRYMRILYTTDPTATWSYHEYDSGHQHAPFDLRYINGEWVMTGVKYDSPNSPGFVATASSLTGTWTFKTNVLSMPNNSTYRITGIDFDGSTYALGYNENLSGNLERVYTATSIPGTWTAGTAYIQATGFVRYHEDSGVWTLIQGSGAVTYTSSPTGAWTDFYGNTDGGITNFNYINSVAASPDYWVIAGDYDNVSVKLGYREVSGGFDGTYTEITDHGITEGSGTDNISSVAYADGYFVLAAWRSSQIRVTYVLDSTTASTLRQRQSPRRSPSRVGWL